jgi:NADPH2:quinone reductase
MYAVRQHVFGGPEVLGWEELPTPEPGPGEVLLRVHSACINHYDILSRRGISPGMPLPRIVGIDCAGTVQRDGRGLLAPGTPVVVLGESLGNGGPGAYGTHVCVRGHEVFALPSDLDLEQAACLGISWLTAWYAVVRRGAVRPGQILLIQGVGGGVASAALQIAVSRGIRVWATTSSAEKAAAATALGAERVLNYREVDVVSALGHSADVVLNAVGGDTIQQGCHCLKDGGRILSIGTAYGREFRLDGYDFLCRELSLVGVNISPHTPEQRFAMYQEVAEEIRSGRLRVLVDRRFPMADAAAAHAHVERHEHFGKVVLFPPGA